MQDKKFKKVEGQIEVEIERPVETTKLMYSMQEIDDAISSCQAELARWQARKAFAEGAETEKTLK